MTVHIHPHARERMAERGATEAEVVATVERGEQYPVKFGRSGFRRNFVYEQEWRGKLYLTKQLEVIAIADGDRWLALTVIVKYF